MSWGIGLRNIKTGIAICICLLIGVIFRIDSPFYAAIATIISMENTITNSFAAGRHRTMGTLVGALIGACLAFVDPGNVLLCAIGVVIVIYVCNLLHWNKSVSIGCIVFLAVMLNLGSDGANPWAYGLHRIIDTLIGISVAVAVNYLIFPPRLEERLEQHRVAFAEQLSNAFKKMAEKGEPADLPVLRGELISLEQTFEQWKNEIHPRKVNAQAMDQKAEVLASYRHVYEHLVIMQRLRDELGIAAGKAGLVTGTRQAEPPGAATLPDDSRKDSRMDQHQLDQYQLNQFQLNQNQLNEQSEIVYGYHRNWIYQELRRQGLPVPDIQTLRSAPSEPDHI
ncbi:FUSC family protein [Paenibacillus physcomitrellae]|uniref:Aromatic acid exporter family protein n=1 Tax=Paenibacillus physcomitrellae TaxID=1619311 RepID=A0ABQ1GK02_9BACL|nr:aromatic acid exporter family protein [Paenibacillus physcomitrellae]GGA45394.1 hypothetical protein GCM10010917_33370 [Paenibacillus physcomitrellae]